MKIEKSKTYTSDNSDLALKILHVISRHSDHVHVKGTLFEKKTGHVFETNTKYKLYFKNIEHWYEIPNN